MQQLGASRRADDGEPRTADDGEPRTADDGERVDPAGASSSGRREGGAAPDLALGDDRGTALAGDPGRDTSPAGATPPPEAATGGGVSLDGQSRRPRRLRSQRRQMSLRSRLLLGLVIVTTVGLGIAGFAVYGQIRSYLVNQLDAQIVSQARGNACVGGGPRDLPQGTFIYEMSSSLQELCPPTSLTYVQPATSTYPDLPTAALHEVVSSGNGALLTVSSPAGIDYRVYAWVPQSVFGPSALQVIAVPLTAVDDTLHRLVLIDLAVSAAVLLLLIVLGYAVVRVGLRPLEAIEETAGKIAAGDLSRRVARDEPETEVGRLGASLNAMLSQIENAFGEQQASEQRLRQFIADASHELRTPLTSIRGYAELFRRGAAARPEDLGRSMRRIEDEAARMGVLVEDMLLLARLDQGRPLERRPVDLAAIAADAAADAQAVDPGRPVSYEAAGAVVVEGDEARLRQVAGNLVQNAVVHTPPGTPVWVRVGREGATAVLEVADAGPGLSPEHAAHIFERFYRADSSRARQSGGTGLGLAIVASLAAAHGGRASVTTAPGSGARFRVELPLLAQPLPPPAAAPTFGGPTGFGESWDGGPEASSSEPSPPDHRAAP